MTFAAVCLMDEQLPAKDTNSLILSNTSIVSYFGCATIFVPAKSRHNPLIVISLSFTLEYIFYFYSADKNRGAIL